MNENISVTFHLVTFIYHTVLFYLIPLEFFFFFFNVAGKPSVKFLTLQKIRAIETVI